MIIMSPSVVAGAGRTHRVGRREQCRGGQAARQETDRGRREGVWSLVSHQIINLVVLNQYRSTGHSQSVRALQHKFITDTRPRLLQSVFCLQAMLDNGNEYREARGLPLFTPLPRHSTQALQAELEQVSQTINDLTASLASSAGAAGHHGAK